MENIRKYINIPPGKLIARQLLSKQMTQAELARRICIAPQELNAILKGRRGLPVELALRIEKELSFEEGFLSYLQVLNTIERIKRESVPLCKPPKIRRILFWDTDFDKINWTQSKNFVLKRVEQYGTSDEIDTVRRYYGIKHQSIPVAEK